MSEFLDNAIWAFVLVGGWLALLWVGDQVRVLMDWMRR